MTNKKTATAMALFLIPILIASFVALPTSNAAVTKKTYPFIGAMPNPVGVGQEVLLHVGISDPTVWPQPGWTGLTVTVTKPDGTTETLGPFTTDTTGGTGGVYRPTTIGTYYLQTNFPQQVLQYERPGRTFPAGTIMQASTSEKFALTVKESPTTYYPGTPLPDFYWTRPINSQLREWTSISGSFPTVPNNRFAPYNDGPESPHILWAKPLAEGGLVGGDLGYQGYETGDAYEPKFSGSVILDGILFYHEQIGQNDMPAFNSTLVEQPVVAVNLKSGEELWKKVLGNNERLAFGQTMYWQTMNMYGAFSYIWTTVGGTWKAYDPLTGRWEWSIRNVPSGSRVYGPNGEILIYTMNSAKGWMTQWNTTSVAFKTYFDYYDSGADGAASVPNAKYYAERWRPQGITFNSTKGYDWNITIPTGLPGSANAYFPENRIIGSLINRARPTEEPIVTWGISLKPGQRGQLLFNTTWQPPAGGLELNFGTASLEDGVFTVRAKELRGFFGFSIDTGQKLWGPTDPRPYMDLFMGGPSGESGVLAYGNLYLGTLGGVLQCIDTKTGELKWAYNNTMPYPELVWGQGNWPIEFAFVTDGKVYLLHSEHSGNSPLPRGAPFVCLDAETGEVIFRVDGLVRATVWGGDPMIADSTMIMFSTYDNRIYAIGKGPSATSVEAPDIGVPFGTPVTIKGMVTDVSPGMVESAMTARFPNGVPAVSDESQGGWMKHVFAQFPALSNTTGVEVTLSVLDSNGNYREIGRTTSNADGFYSLMWTPDISGKYTVTATFAGSKSYYSSHSTTAFSVAEPPEPEPTTDTNNVVTMPPIEAYFVGATIAIILAVALVGFLLMRKRP